MSGISEIQGSTAEIMFISMHSPGSFSADLHFHYRMIVFRIALFSFYTPGFFRDLRRRKILKFNYSVLTDQKFYTQTIFFNPNLSYHFSSFTPSTTEGLLCLCIFLFLLLSISYKSFQ